MQHPIFCSKFPELNQGKVAGVKVYPRQNQNSRAHAVSTWISLWHHGAVHAVCACFSLCDAILACISLWHHRPMHARTAWDLKFQFCLRSQIYLYSSYFEIKVNNLVKIDISAENTFISKILNNLNFPAKLKHSFQRGNILMVHAWPRSTHRHLRK